jgi:hypothetical protein
MTSVHKYIPRPDTIERFERRIAAPADLVMHTAYDFDMQSIWLIRLIINARKFVLGGTPDVRKPKGLVRECLDIGWGILEEEPGRLLVCGAVCQPWFGDVKFTPIPADKFLECNEPDLVKIAWSLEAVETDSNSTLFVHEVRAAATDHDSRKKFLRYWRWARFGIVAIRLLLLPAIKRKAERSAA